jgi:uncharacterized protein YbjT (DUF2867 family)
MYGITGKVGGATARHLLKQGKQVRALVRNREKAAQWVGQGVELVERDWNYATSIAAASVGKYVHEWVPDSQLVMMDATGHCPHMRL